MVAAGALMLGAASGSRARAQLTTRQPATQDAVTPQSIDRRLDERAADLRRTAPQGADRYVLFDLAFPSGEPEYRAVGKTALILIVALSKRAEELPLRRVFLRIGDREFDLPSLGSRRSETGPGSLARAMFGANRWDAFYLAPVGALLRDSVVMCDFAKNRAGFTINRAPLPPPDYIVADRERDTADTAQDAAVKAFVTREYPGFGIIGQ